MTDLTATYQRAGNITVDEANGANVLNVAAANGDATVTSATGALNVTRPCPRRNGDATANRRRDHGCKRSGRET